MTKIDRKRNDKVRGTIRVTELSKKVQDPSLRGYKRDEERRRKEEEEGDGDECRGDESEGKARLKLDLGRV